MKVFISWSGSRSKAVASTLRQWLTDVLQNLKPWMSEMDILAGTRWSAEVARELSETKFGIICLTRSNVAEPWILFEAGAIARTLQDALCAHILSTLLPKTYRPAL